MGLPSVENLSWYLAKANSSEKPRRNKFSVIIDIFHHLPWNRDTIMCVLRYTFSFISNLEHSDDFTEAITALDEIAKCVRDETRRAEDRHSVFEFLHDATDKEDHIPKIETKQRELSEMLVNSFFPEVVPRFFTVPKSDQLPESNKHLYQNEILAGFMNFLLQVLYHESNISEDKVQWWALMRKELASLLVVLGDIPFQCIHHELVEQVINLLAEFEILANEAGSLVYDVIFAINQMEANKFHAETLAWSEKVDLLNAKIKKHCSNFSELNMSAISRSIVVDSFFIIHSLIEDIENLMNQGLKFNHGDVLMEHMKTLHGELTQTQSYINEMQDNEEKEGLVPIRDLSYEAEYLINSLVVGNIHIWYLHLRLPSIIHMIKLALIGLQHISDSKLMKASDEKESFMTIGNTATIDENRFLDFNDDNALEASYKHMPCNLKPCFLYFAAFHRVSEISRKEITLMWIAEGFIQKEGNKSVEDTAETYLLDLINRNLVLITKKGSDGRIKKCKIQSLLHGFCVRKAEEENFIKVNYCGFSMYERYQRLCVPFPFKESYIFWRPFGLHCRSYRDSAHQSSYCFQTMALLKAVYQVSPAALAFPAQLRYLGVHGQLSSKMVANLVNLEFIYVRNEVINETVYVPSVVLRMVKLRHLVMEGKAEFELEEDCSSNMATNLRTLSRVRINDKKDHGLLKYCRPLLNKLWNKWFFADKNNGVKDELDILRCFPNLHKLECIIITGTEFPDLSFMDALESLKLSFRSEWNYSAWSMKIAWSKIQIPSTIKKVSLVGKCYLSWEMMSTIGRLPNLEVLKLYSNAFMGEVWETRDGEFQKLKSLNINLSSSLKVWMSCSYHFPVLECLVLHDCFDLVEISIDFANIPTLQRIELFHCTNGTCLSALQIQIGKQIQVDLRDQKVMEELKNPTHDDLMNLWICMDEYFKVGGFEGFIDKLSVIDQTEMETTRGDDEVSEEFVKKLTIKDQTEDETTTSNDEPLIFMNHHTYFVVVSYALQFSSDSENLAFMRLRCIAESYIIWKELISRYPRYVDEITKSRREFSDMLVNNFISLVQKFFKFPKMEQQPNNNDKQLKKNEILASFMNFLLQMLLCEINTDSAGADQFSLLQKELSFLLVVLGDLPFQHNTHHELHEQLNDLLAEFEMLANKTGSLLLSCVFPFKPMKVSRFHVETNALLEMAKLLNVMIEEYCNNFSKLPVYAIVRSSGVDSSFIVHSLVEDIESIIMNGQFGRFTLDNAIKEQIETLYGELSQSFINVMGNTEEREGLSQIRDLAYEAEYLINSLVAGNIHIWYVNLRLQPIIQQIKLACTGLQSIFADKGINGYDGKVSFPTKGNTATIHENQFIDFNHDITQKILNDLIRKTDTSRQVIYIYGMPGIGKTTTANHLYKRCLSYFDRHAFCVVSQNYSVKNLLIEILMSLRGGADESELWKKDDADLGVLIHKTLSTRRYIIVLDDVWHYVVFDELHIYFPKNGKGSRIIITTRNEDVSPSNSIIYKLPFLSGDQCWNLLKEKVFAEDPLPSHLVSVGKRIAAKCSGIPLAVVSIGGVLVNLEKEESEWERVEKKLENILLDDQSDYKKIMELSYQHLPHHMKPCFLCFARYPDNTEISTKELARFWISQGFIQKDGNKSPEEIAEMYLSNLINRSLVMTATRRSIGGMKTCRVHDLLHDICIKKADEENFNSTNLLSTYNKHQHLCLPSSSNNHWRPFGHHFRSFRGHSKQSSGFRTMALLKAVDLFQKERFEPLIFDLPWQLRYLGFSGIHIPATMVDNLVNLEVICVRAGFQEVVIPSVILRMTKLTHLFVRHKAKFEENCNSNISETTNLRSISRVVIGSKHDQEILRKSPHLRTLKCICDGEIFPDLSSLAELQSLRIDYERYFKCGILLSKDRFPSTIKKLCLSESKLGWEEMSIIGELPNLEVLKLEYNAFVGEEWKTKDDQFKELRFLKINCLDLKQWSTESSHFPKLEQLLLSGCFELLEIPSDLGYIPTLQSIELNMCSKGACLSAIEIEQEQLQYENHLQIGILDQKWTKEELMKECTESTRESESD